MEISEKDFEKLLFTLEVCVKRIKVLEKSTAEWRADYENFKEYYKRGDTSKTDVLELQATRHLELSDTVVALGGAVDNLCRAVFPERYVDGVRPALLVTRDPQKLV